MSDGFDMKEVADKILKGEDTNKDFIEHYGVKGQRRGVRRYQNDDGSLTSLGRQHYGIGTWLKKRFSPAEKGYRMAKKQKEIDAKIKYQQSVNQLKELKNQEKYQKQQHKQERKAFEDERKAQKFDQKMREEALKSQERQYNLGQKTALDLQKQRDVSQAEREREQREYQTKQKIAEGKTLLGRVKKAAAFATSLSTIAIGGKKLADAIGIDTSGFISDWSKKINEETKKVKDVAEQATKNKPEPPKDKPASQKTSDAEPSSKSDSPKDKPVSQKTSDTETSSKSDSPKKEETSNNSDGPKYSLKKKYANLFKNATPTDEVKNIENRNKYGEEARKLFNRTSGDNTENISKSEKTPTEKKNDYKYNFKGVTPADKRTVTSKSREYNNDVKSSLQVNAEDYGEAGFERRARRFSMSPEAKKLERQQRKEAQEKAKEIKKRWDNFYKFQTESTSTDSSLPKSDTGKFITSISVSKLTDILSGKVPETIYPRINLGAAMNTKIGTATDFSEEYNKSTKIQRKSRQGHRKTGRWSDMDAGDIEDAE